MRNVKPFYNVFMDNEPTVKMSLKAGELYQLRMLALSEDSFLDFVCDLFLFCSVLWVMPPADLSGSRHSYIKGNTFTYW